MNNITGKTKEELERAVVDAAAVLANEQVAEIRHARRVESASLKLTEARDAKDDADFELSFASLQLQGAKHMELVCKRALAKTGWRNSPDLDFEALMAVRKQLFSLPLGTDAGIVLETAKEYGAKVAANWRVREEAQRIRNDFEKALNSVKLACAAHAQAMENAKLKDAACKFAQQEFDDLFKNAPKYLPGFGAQSALADAAAELAGVKSQQVAMSFFHTEHLNVVLPEDVCK